MSDEIKPVTPAAAIQQQFPPKIPDGPYIASRRNVPEKKPHTEKNDGYDLSGISVEQAQQLLAMPLMQDADALASNNFRTLRDVIERRATGKIAEQGDIATLITASQRVDSLIRSTYTTARAGEAFSKPTSSELLAKIQAFNVTASSFGKSRDIMIG